MFYLKICVSSLNYLKSAVSRTCRYIYEKITLRSTVFTATGAIYGVAKIGEVLLKVPQFIAFSILMTYGFWFVYSAATEVVLTKILKINIQ